MTATHHTPLTQDGPLDAATAVFERLSLAWNAADGAAFGAPFTDDADFVDITGAHHRGREVIAQGHQGIFDSIYRGSTVTYRVESAQEIAPGVVLAGVSARLDVPAGPMAGGHASRVTAVLTEHDGAWWVRAFHNTLERPRG